MNKRIIGFIVAVRWGIVAVAAAYALRAYLLSPIPIVLVKKLIDIEVNRYLANIAPQVLATMIMSAVLIALLPLMESTMPMPGALAAAILLGIGIYFATLMVIKRELLTETMEMLRSGIGSRNET